MNNGKIVLEYLLIEKRTAVDVLNYIDRQITMVSGIVFADTKPKPKPPEPKEKK